MVESKNIPKGEDNVDIGCGNEFGGGGEEEAVDPNIEMVNNIVDSFKYTQTTLDGVWIQVLAEATTWVLF